MVLQEYDRIMVAIDGSSEAELAFRKAVAIVLRNNSSLIVTHIVDTRFLRVFPNIENPGSDQQYMDQTLQVAKNTLEAYEAWARSKGVKDIRAVLKYGSPKIELAEDLPREYDIDLLLVGATGLNAVERIFIGSVSEYVVRHAICDVLVVRTPIDVEEKVVEIIPQTDRDDLEQ